MAITPSTNLKLLKCPLELDNKNQLTFSSKQAQYNYFNSLPHTDIINDSYYQRKDSYIEYPVHIDTIIEYNYCMYQNENYDDKWFYAFIVNMVYLNDGTTRIYIATDVYQTWQFDITWKQSFIEREMLSTNDDVPGANLIPENLELGELKVGGTANLDELIPVAIVCYTRDPQADGLTQQQPTATGIIANGIPNGMYYCIVSFDMLQGLLQTINSIGHGDAIMTIFTVPALAVVGFNRWTINDIITGGLLWWLVTDFKANPISKTLNSRPSSLDGYTPRNKKLLTFPYVYLGYNPPNGSQNIYRYEDFPNGTPIFKILSELNQNPTVAFIPQNYRGASGDSMSDASSLGGYPTIGWTTDYYNTWLAQNDRVIKLEQSYENYTYNQNEAMVNQQQLFGNISNIAGAIGSAVSGNFAGGASQALDAGTNMSVQPIQEHLRMANHGYKIDMLYANKLQQKLLPNHGTLSGSNATLLGYGLMDNNIFTRYNIKSDFARRIDTYFDMFGYKTIENKLPNLNNRPNWNYIKTVTTNIEGDIPQQDLQTIKEIFESGVTLWHNPDTFLDYSQNNR